MKTIKIYAEMPILYTSREYAVSVGRFYYTDKDGETYFVDFKSQLCHGCYGDTFLLKINGRYYISSNLWMSHNPGLVIPDKIEIVENFGNVARDELEKLVNEAGVQFDQTTNLDTLDVITDKTKKAQIEQECEKAIVLREIAITEYKYKKDIEDVEIQTKRVAFAKKTELEKERDRTR